MTRHTLPFILALLFGLGGSAQAQVVLVQSVASTDTAPFATDGIEAVALGSEAGVGGFVGVCIVVTGEINRSVSSITDDGGNSYALLSQGGQDATSEGLSVDVGEVWAYGAVLAFPANTITVTMSDPSSSPGVVALYHVTGQHATPVEDVAVSAAATVTSHPTGPVVTANAGNLLFGCLAGTDDGWTADGAWTEIAHEFDAFNTAMSAHDAVDATSSTWTPTSGGNEGSAGVVVAIQPAAGGGETPVTKKLMILGVGQ